MFSSVAPVGSTREDVWLWVDPTRRCNLKCNLCYTRFSHAPDDLTPARFNAMLERLLDDARIRIRHFTFNWRGEPLMNKHFVEMFARLAYSANGFPVQFHTNAMLLTKQKCERLLEIEADYTICLSIDGGSRASHEKNRGAGSYDKAIAGALRLLDARGSRTSPRIILYQLDLREDPSDYDSRFIELTEKADLWQVIPPVLPSGDSAPIANQPYTAGGTDAVVEWPALSLASSVPQAPCFWLGNALCISPGGDVSVCLLSNRPDGIIGNIFEQTPSEILIQSKLRRADMEAKGRSQIRHCQHCRKTAGDGYPMHARSASPMPEPSTVPG